MKPTHMLMTCLMYENARVVSRIGDPGRSRKANTWAYNAGLESCQWNSIASFRYSLAQILQLANHFPKRMWKTLLVNIKATSEFFRVSLVYRLAKHVVCEKPLRPAVICVWSEVHFLFLLQHVGAWLPGLCTGNSGNKSKLVVRLLIL